ncbi:MAG TPA: sensor histidine kinase [Actinocrinis sp.]|nr:sensor histidine kinase [Actinocrinis sp.]
MTTAAAGSPDGSGVPGGGSGAAAGYGFRHEAMFYAGGAQFRRGVSAFVREGLSAGEPVMAAVVGDRARTLREELGADAAAVTFVDMAELGRNPARIIPAWQSWVDEHQGGGRPFRAVGEPFWAGRSAAEASECRQYDALLGAAFGAGPAWRLLCPYDTENLGAEVIAHAARSHPVLVHRGGVRLPNPDYRRPGSPLEALSAEPLPEPAGKALETFFDREDLARVRQIVGDWATLAGLDTGRVKDLILAMNELACNSIQYGGGDGVLRLWEERGVLVGEVRDRGVIRDPLVGRRQPTGSAQGGAGLWIVNQVCDLVQLRSVPGTGVTVRVHVVLPADGGAQFV